MNTETPKYKDLINTLEQLCVRTEHGRNAYYDYANLSDSEKRTVMLEYVKTLDNDEAQQAWEQTIDPAKFNLTKQFLSGIVLAEDKHIDQHSLRGLHHWMQRNFINQQEPDIITEIVDYIIKRTQADDEAMISETKEAYQDQMHDWDYDRRAIG